MNSYRWQCSSNPTQEESSANFAPGLLSQGVEQGTAGLLASSAGLLADSAVLMVLGMTLTLVFAPADGDAGLVLIEKVWRWGPVAGKLAGVAALGLAVATIWLPGLGSRLARRAPMMH